MNTPTPTAPAAAHEWIVGMTHEQADEYRQCLDALCREAQAFEPTREQMILARKHALAAAPAAAQLPHTLALDATPEDCPHSFILRAKSPMCDAWVPVATIAASNWDSAAMARRLVECWNSHYALANSRTNWLAECASLRAELARLREVEARLRTAAQNLLRADEKPPSAEQAMASIAAMGELREALAAGGDK